MDLAGCVVEAVVLQKRSYREVADAHGVSKSWVAKVLSRYRQGGYAALQPHSKAAKTWGFPAALLTDNGCVYTAAHRGGRAALEQELLALGIVFKHSRPYHPQTCGKVERFHQTLKTFLAKQPPAATITTLQAQI